MPRRSVELLLSDIVTAAEAIQSFVAEKSLDEYKSDPMLRAAVERQFIIIGEALGQAIQLEPQIAERITDASQVVRVRHRLAHGYFTVADDVIWGIIERHLNALLTETYEVLRERSSRQ